MANGYARRIPEVESRLKSWHFLDVDGRYTGLAPYNNFHFSSLRLWRNPFIARYLQCFEAGHHLVRDGWLDANLFDASLPFHPSLHDARVV